MNLTVYMYGGNWVFDEPNICEREPFVQGSTNIISKVAIDKGIKNVESRLLNITFDKEPLPKFDCKMEWIKTENNGNWYKCLEKNMIGWLCPMLLYYFKTPPKEIYFLIKDGGEAPDIEYDDYDIEHSFSIANVALKSEEGTIVSWDDLDDEYSYLDESFDNHELEDGYPNDPFLEFKKVQKILNSKDDPYSIH